MVSEKRHGGILPSLWPGCVSRAGGLAKDAVKETSEVGRQIGCPGSPPGTGPRQKGVWDEGDRRDGGKSTVIDWYRSFMEGEM